MSNQGKVVELNPPNFNENDPEVVFNEGLGAGIEVALKNAWTRWVFDDVEDTIPPLNVLCVGIWIHKTKRSQAGLHAECFVMTGSPDGDGGYEIEGVGGTELRTGVYPDYWIVVPKPLTPRI